jgi:predicted transcriptional regulator
MMNAKGSAELAAVNRLAVVDKIYSRYPLNQTKRGGIAHIAEEIDASKSIVEDTLNALRDANVVDIQIKYGNQFGQGRASFLTVVKPKEDAVKAVKDFNEEISNKSLKQKILTVLTAHPVIETTKELNDYLKQFYGIASDNHNVTHVLYSLQKEGKLTFAKGTTKDRVPYNIRLTWKKLSESPVPVQNAPTSQETIEVEPERTGESPEGIARGCKTR